jgi:hypothetical protein
MKSFENNNGKTIIKEEIAEAEKQKAAFKVNDRRSGKKYEVVMDESGEKQVLNREEKVVELENKIREAEKQEITKKLSQEKDDLINEIKDLESEFKKPGIKSKKELIEKSILEKEEKVRELENQLKATENKKADKKEKLPKSEEIKPDKSESANTKKEEVDWDNSPMIKAEGGVDASAQGTGAKEEKKTEDVNWDESAVIDAEAGGKKTKKEDVNWDESAVINAEAGGKKTKKEEVNWDESDVIKAEKGWDSKKEGANETPVKKVETGTEEERKQNIEKLWQEVEKSRKEYLEKDCRNNKVTTRLKKFFGSFLKKDKEGSGYESDKELAEYRAYYDNSLLEHKKAVLADVRLKGASEKEILDIAKFYQVEANVNLADVHDQVKIENQEGKISGFIKEHSKELVERYKKMSLVKKIAIGAAFGLAGVGSIYIGGAAVGIVGSAIAARRAIMGAITGTTVALGFESRGKKKTAEKNQAEMKDLEVEMLGLSEEEKVKILEDFVNKNIKDEERKIDKVKNKNLRHLAYGLAAGLGVVLAPKIMRMFSETGTPGGSAPEQPGEQNVPVSEPEGPEKLGMTDEEIAEKLAAEEAEKTPEATFETGSVVVEVQKGDSLWKIIDKQLENQEGYADLNEAQKTYVIDALKDKVAADPEKFGLDNIDKLKIGQKIDLSELFQDKQPENLIAGVQDLSEGQMQNILDNNQKLKDWFTANPGEELTSAKTTEILEGEPKGAEELGRADDISEASNIGEASGTARTEGSANTSENSNIEEALKTEEVRKAPEASEKLKTEDGSDVDEQAEKEPEIQFEKAINGSEVALSAEEAHKMIEKSADDLGNKIAGVNMFSEKGGFTGRRVYWNEIKDIRYADIQSEGNTLVAPYAKARLDEVASAFKEKFGSEGAPEPGEKLKDWLVRLVEKHGENIPDLEDTLKRHRPPSLRK